MAKKDKVVKRNDGVNGTYSKETLDNGSTIELLSRRNPNESVTYTERFITPQQDTSYYVYNNTTPPMDRHVIGEKYVTPTKYNKMGWLGKRIIAGVRPDSWDAKFDSYQEPIDSFQQGGEILKAWGGKKLSEQMSDEDAQALRSGTYRKSYTDEFGNKIEAKPAVWKNGSIGNGLVYRAITPQNDTLYNTVGFDLEPSDTPGYQTIVPWGGEYVHSYNDDSSHWERSESELSKRLSVPDIRQKYRPVRNEAPMPNMQEGGNVPSNDQQQQLFVAIITEMAKTLGVEPSQELAEAVMTAFENNDDSQGLLTLFTKTKDKFMNETGLFREGGKMIAFVEKFKCGGKSPKKKTSKKQEGGEVAEEVGAGAGYITTPVNDRQMRRNWRQATGGTRREARQAQRNLTNYIEGQGGISHRGARNAAAAMMGDPQRFATPTQTPTLKPMGQAQLNVSTPALNGPQDIADMSYDHLGFNQAFGRARGNGVNTFNWRGKEYTTELAAPSAAPQGRVDQVQENVNNAVDGWQERTNNAVDGWQERANSWVDGTRYGDSRLVNGAQTVGNAVVDGTQWLGNAAVDGVQAAGNAVVDGTQAIGRGVRRIFRRRQ